VSACVVVTGARRDADVQLSFTLGHRVSDDGLGKVCY
jgi:hypothetical protein